MKILYFSRDYTTHDLRFLRKMSQWPHEFFYLRLENDGKPYEAAPVPSNIHIVDWAGGKAPLGSPAQYLPLLPDFLRVLEQIKPDLVHAGPVQSCGFLTALADVHPFVIMSWGSDLLTARQHDRQHQWVTQFALKKADALVTDCAAVTAAAQSFADFSRKPVAQFPWGIDLAQFQKQNDPAGLRKKLGWEQCFVVLSTRTWEPVYGTDTLLHAFGRAYSTNPHLRLALLGSGSLASTVRDLIRRYRLEQAVYSPGMVDHQTLQSYFNAADLYLSCTLSDGSSISLLEAMACELPVLASAVDGNLEWIRPGQNGWLVPPGDAAAFAASILQAASLAPQQRDQIGKRNRAWMTQRANWDVNSQALLQLYQRFQ